MKWRRSILVACIACGAILNLAAQSNDWKKRIISKTEYPLGSLWNPRKGPSNVLIVDKRRFEHLIGLKPFYLPVPGTNAVLFVVAEENYLNAYHFFNMSTDEDINIKGVFTDFGSSIGTSPCPDTIENRGNGRLVLTTTDVGARSSDARLTNLWSIKETFYLDLPARRFSVGAVRYYDKAGKIIYEVPGEN